MNEPPGDRDPETPPQAPETPPAPAGEPDAPTPEQTPGRWLLGCLGKTLLVFFIVVLLVFGACFMMLTSL
jgi:hypothetical protein